MEKSRAAETILTITLGFLVLFLIIYWRSGNEHFWMLYTAGAIGILGLLSKWLRIQIHIFWFWFADKLGYVMSRVVLSIIFVLVVLPFGSVARIFRKDLMFLKGGKESYYIQRKHRYSSEDLENPW